MKRIIILMTVMVMPCWLLAQQLPTATLKIHTIHMEVNAEHVDWDKTFEVTLTDGVMSPVVIYEKDGLKYGMEFTYKKGRNRIKLVRRGYAIKAGSDVIKGKQEKDMQELKTSAPGSLNKRVVENILLSREKLESVNVSFNYELIYK